MPYGPAGFPLNLLPSPQTGLTKGNPMQPIIGQHVLYKLSEYDAGEITRRRADFAAFNAAHRDAAAQPGDFPGRSGHVGHFGNPVREGDVCPAFITAAFGLAGANLQVLLDGNDAYWATSRAPGDQPGQWAPAPQL